jgi:OOP family OmpA-OmpF porin
MFKKIAIAAALAIVSSVSMAADAPKFYVGGDIGTTKFDGESDRESGFGAFAGYQFNQNIAIEAGYRRLVDANDTFFGFKTSTKVDQFAVSAVGTLPLSNGFSVFGRLGANRLSDKTTVAGRAFKDHATRGLYGIGVAYSISPAVSVRLELQKPISELTNLSAGVSYKF